MAPPPPPPPLPPLPPPLRTPDPAPRPRRGFSLVEAVMASLIVGVLMVSALQTVGSAVSARRSHALMRQGDLLARQLLDEVAQCRYAEPDDAPAWGREGAEAAASRALWDDVDDYDGLVEATLTLKDGTAVPGASGWQRRVKVERLQASNLAVVAAVTDTSLKRITVTAQSPGGVKTTLVALRGKSGTHDGAIAPGASCVTWAGVALAIGEDGGTVASGTSLLNRPNP